VTTPRRPRPDTGASPIVILVALVALGALFFVFRGMAPASVPDAPAAAAASSPTPTAGAPAAIQEAQAQARRNDSLLQAVTRRAAEEDRRRYGTPAAPKRADPRVLNSLSGMIADAQSLWNRGRSDALAIPEASADAGLNTAAARTATQQWIAWTRRWDQQLIDFARRLSNATNGLGFDDPAYIVNQELSFFINDLRAVTVNPASTTNIPMRSRRQSQFDAAKTRLDQAERKIQELRRQG